MAVVSTDTLQLAHVKETVSGVTPASPQFKLWRTTGEGLVFTPQTSDSGELGGASRFAKPANVTGMTISGDINFELAKFTALEEAIAGVFAANWGECPLTGAPGGGVNANRITVGKELQTFTIEKRFPNPAFVRGTVPTIADGATGAQTTDITITGAASTGTGMIVVNIKGSAGVAHHISVPVTVGMTSTAAATALAAAIDATTDLSATATTGTVTVDAGTGNTIESTEARLGQDEFFYQRFKGVSYSSFSLAVSPNNPVTGSVGISGGAPELDVLPLAGANYDPAGTNPVFTAPQVMRLDIGQSMGIGTHCWTSLNINIDSQNRGIPCIGTQGDREVVLGTLTASVTGEVYFSDQSILEALLNNDTIGNSVITLSDADGNLYRWDFYGMKPVEGQVAAGGAGQDLTIPINLQPTPVTVCEDANNNPWQSGLILSTIDSAPVLP